jgi:uncharacterized protein (TIGR02300 family)
VTKPELGTKRICAGCNAKFYDLHRTPIVCPTCEAVFVLPKPAPVRPPRRGFAPLAAVPAMAAPATPEPAVAAETADGDKEAGAGVPLLEDMDED